MLGSGEDWLPHDYVLGSHRLQGFGPDDRPPLGVDSSNLWLDPLRLLCCGGVTRVSAIMAWAKCCSRGDFHMYAGGRRAYLHAIYFDLKAGDTKE